MNVEGSKRHLYSTGDAELDVKLRELIVGLEPIDAQLVFELMATALRLAQDPISRLDRKIANSALKEMRYAFSVFARYRDARKISIFGSARVKEGDVLYEMARDFSHEVVQRGWMVATGAGPGIMEAGHAGAGGENSFGVNILLPFEAKANPVIAGDPKLINFKYFFTRKLMFIKEADAFVLLPGGFGTLDEAFELLTLIQTGKSDLHPIVMLDEPSGHYWKDFKTYVANDLLSRGYVDESDLDLFKVTDDISEAIEEIENFYRVYHSQRYVNEKLILRLNEMPGTSVLHQLSADFADILAGPIEVVGPSKPEVRDDDVPHLPRIALRFDRMHAGRLRMLVDRLNATAS